MNVNALAETHLTDDAGADVRLGELWAKRPVALVFLRHFGCSACREHVADLQPQLSRIRATGGELVAIGMGTAAHAADFRKRSEITFPLLVASDTSVHEAFGLRNGSWWHVVGPPAWPGMVRIHRKGHRAKLTAADMSQLGGTFVIDREGRTRWEHRPKYSTQNSKADDIVAALARCARAGAAG